MECAGPVFEREQQKETEENVGVHREEKVEHNSTDGDKSREENNTVVW